MKWRNRLIHAGILMVVFILAVVMFSYYTNKNNDNMTTDMGAAQRPQVTFSYNGYAVNDMPAYKNQMDITAVRDTVTPVAGGQLEMHIKAYENVIDSISYYVYSLDGQNKLLSKTLKNPKETATLTLEGEELLGEERVLEVVLHMDGERQMHYYTRIRNADGLNALNCLDYIRNFHENALVKAEGVGIGVAIEPNEEGDNTTLQHVTIHSDYNHVTWGNLQPQVEGPERWSIKEMNGSYTSVELQYRVRGKGEENDGDVYQVKEFFRVRHIASSSKTYLLDYDRTMNQIFNPTKKVLNEKGIVLGIADRNLPYMVNKDGTVVSFVQANEMWNYNRNTDEISLVFSFADAENTDVRNLLSQHEIRLLDMDSNGNTTFAVYGYMNRGIHEGEVGAAIYYYNMAQNSVEEKLFVSCDKSYDRAIAEMGRFVYYNVDTKCLYMLMNGTIYELNVDRGSRKEIVTGLAERQYQVSDDGHIIAYQKGENAQNATVIAVKNFASGKENTIECGADEYIQPLGFVKNDFVYGVARTADVGTTASGKNIIPMYKIEIVNGKNKVIKTYEQQGKYILSADFDQNMITLNRAVKNGSYYAAIDEDYITSNEETEESNISIETYVTELKERQVRITYADGIEDKEPKLLKPKQVVVEQAMDMKFDSTDKKNAYYVYGKGHLQGIYESAGRAIQEADACNGVVVDSNQTYIWERGNRDLKYKITDQDAKLEELRILLAGGSTPMDAMKEVYGESLDLSGCSVEQVLYIINQGRPVIGMLGGHTPVILIGYGETTVTYINVSTAEQVTEEIGDVVF